MSTPPKIKVLEALGSIADGRVKIVDENRAIVSSSMGEKEYTVYVDTIKGIAFSDDNGTRFRGYVGYPIIAVLMMKKLLPFEERIAAALSGIPWKELNEKFKKYALVEDLVKREAERRGVKGDEIEKFVSLVLNNLSKIPLRYVENPPLL